MNWYIEDRFGNKNSNYINTVKRLATPVMDEFCLKLLEIKSMDNIINKFNSCFDETGPFMSFRREENGFYIQYNSSIDIRFSEPFKAIIRNIKLEQILKNN